MDYFLRFGTRFSESAVREGVRYEAIDDALERFHERFNHLALPLSRSQSVIILVRIACRSAANPKVIVCQLRDSLVEAQEVIAVSRPNAGFEHEREIRVAQVTHRKWNSDLIPLILAA